MCNKVIWRKHKASKSCVSFKGSYQSLRGGWSDFPFICSRRPNEKVKMYSMMLAETKELIEPLQNISNNFELSFKSDPARAHHGRCFKYCRPLTISLQFMQRIHRNTKSLDFQIVIRLKSSRNLAWTDWRAQRYQKNGCPDIQRQDTYIHGVIECFNWSMIMKYRLSKLCRINWIEKADVPCSIVLSSVPNVSRLWSSPQVLVNNFRSWLAPQLFKPLHCLEYKECFWDFQLHLKASQWAKLVWCKGLFAMCSISVMLIMISKARFLDQRLRTPIAVHTNSYFSKNICSMWQCFQVCNNYWSYL